MRNKTLILIAAVFTVILSACAPGQDRYIEINGYAQGGLYSVTCNLRGVEESPQAIRDSIESILHEIDFTLSGYNRNSMLSRFNEGDTIVPTPLFVNMYDEAHRIYLETDGIVDVSSGPLFDLWGFGFRTGEMPDPEKVEATRSMCGMNRLVRTLPEDVAICGADIMKDDPSGLPQLNYNALAQGYSCDLVAQYLYSIGVKDMMVNIGEIFCDGRNPSGKSWTIGIDSPVDGNNEPGAQVQGAFEVPHGPKGVVTSGNYRKFYIRDGKKYAHSIDPRTGYPVSHNLLSATIVADDALTADAYATYCMVVGLEAAKTFLKSRPDMDACLIYDDDGEFRIWCTDGFVLTSMQ